MTVVFSLRALRPATIGGSWLNAGDVVRTACRPEAVWAIAKRRAAPADAQTAEALGAEASRLAQRRASSRGAPLGRDRPPEPAVPSAGVHGRPYREP
jgi:hypothetical protein